MPKSDKIRQTIGNVTVDIKDCEKIWSTGSGPGGQNRNRRHKTLLLRWPIPDDLRKRHEDKYIEAKSGSKSPEENLNEAIQIIRTRVSEYFYESPDRKDTKPTWSSKMKDRKERIFKSAKKKSRTKINVELD